ncbi:MAG: hypothetical protein JNM68_06780 [Dinghuibacter sp.]|nr:hypothetical protein [Dinghuibacter sp.]
MLSTKTIAGCLAAAAMLLIFSNCRRENSIVQPGVPCIHNGMPVTGPALLYSSGLQQVNFDSAICGFLPLHKDAYWIYTDSFFNTNGSLHLVQQDTLRVKGVYQSPNGPSLFWRLGARNRKGCTGLLYTTDSILYTIAPAFATPAFYEHYTWAGYRAAGYPNSGAPVFGPPGTDSIFTFNHFTDMAYQEKIVNYRQPVTVPAGSYSNCTGFVKRLGWSPDEMIFKPGLGMIKYIVYYNAPPGSYSLFPTGPVQQVSVLTSYHLF